MSFKRWHWIDDILLPGAVLTLRLCWLWPWLELVRRFISPQATDAYLSLPALVLMGAGGFIAARLVLRAGAITTAARAVVIGLGIVTMVAVVWLHYMGLGSGPANALWSGQAWSELGRQATDWTWGPPPVFLALILGFTLWTQGVRDATPLSRHEQVWKTFTVGFIAFVLLFLVGQLDARGLPPGTGSAVWIFFGVGMAALALSALEYAGLGQEKDATIPGMTRYWLGSMLAVVGGILGVGVILALILAPGMLAAFFANLRFLLDWLGAILGVVLVVTAYLVFLIIEPIFNWIRQYIEVPEPEEETLETQSLNEMLDSFWSDPASILPEAVAESLPWVALLLTALALTIAVTIALRILRRPPETSFVETRESILSADLLQGQLSSLWDRLTGRRRQTSVEPFLSLAGEEERRRTIRAVYQEFLARMQALGHPRLPQLTAVAYGQHVEHLDVLHSSSAPDESGPDPRLSASRDATAQTNAQADTGSDTEADAIHTLTAGYIQARYSDTPPTAEQVEAVQQAWAILSAQLAAPETGAGDKELTVS